MADSGEHVLMPRANPLSRPTPRCAGNPSCTWGVPHPPGACDTLAGPGHALEAKASCHPLATLQVRDLRVNFHCQLLSPKGEGGPASALDKVAGFSLIPKAMPPLLFVSSE